MHFHKQSLFKSWAKTTTLSIKPFGERAPRRAVNVVNRTIVTGNQIDIVVALDLEQGQNKDHKPDNQPQRLKAIAKEVLELFPA